jgi:catechol 2,3-dioxygenase-like lactoylglutathione lyase family enzyme
MPIQGDGDMFKRIDHIEIVPRDIDACIEFYTRILRFRLVERKAIDAPPVREVAYLALDDTTLEVVAVENPAPRGSDEWRVGYRMIALEVGDMEEVLAYLESKGIALSWGPVDLGDSIRAEIRDPDGLPIELRQW